MISEFLDQDYLLTQTRAQRAWLSDLLGKAKAGEPAALEALGRHDVSMEQIETAIAALDSALDASKTMKSVGLAPFIPSNPVLGGFQAGMTLMADRHANTVANPATAAVPSATARGTTRGIRARAGAVIDTSPPERLKRQPGAPAAAAERAVTRAPFVEGEDIHYGLDGFRAKFGGLFRKRHSFNKNSAVPAIAKKPARLFLFGDWGTGLPLAQMVTAQIRRQLDAADGTRQQHVIHLGDVYYVGEPEEYSERVIAAGMWPVTGQEKDKIGSWSLNGNHDMYVGGHGYFEKLLRDGRFLRWHQDAKGQPSSFFLIEDAHWQFFGLDTSWNLPSLGGAIFGDPTLKDYGGQNGILTPEQVAWMAQQRNAAKGCVLLTHHQPASSRSSEGQHADEAVKLLLQEGVYGQIDAWFWGHEHRCVVFKPKGQRANPRLAAAPDFCACIGHGGVPVTATNFERNKRIADVAWEEDRLDASSPLYEGERVVPFGFARLDSGPGTLDIRIFDHAGQERYKTLFRRSGASAAIAVPRGVLTSARRAVKGGAKGTKAAKPVKKAPAKKPAKRPKSATKKAAASARQSSKPSSRSRSVKPAPKKRRS